MILSKATMTWAIGLLLIANSALSINVLYSGSLEDATLECRVK